MGCDICLVSQRRVGDGWVEDSFTPFDWRNYDMYGFLADVRNYAQVPPISPQRGLPDDFALNGGCETDQGTYLGEHSYSWLSVSELLAFDYDQTFEDRREGVRTTYRAFLGEAFFEDLHKLEALGVDRVVFGFDS